jgi:hypothetical protein
LLEQPETRTKEKPQAKRMLLTRVRVMLPA